MKTGGERLEHNRGRSAASHLQLESFLASSVSGFVGMVALSVSDEMVFHVARLTDVVTSAPDNLDRDLRSIVELYVQLRVVVEY